MPTKELIDAIRTGTVKDIVGCAVASAKVTDGNYSNYVGALHNLAQAIVTERAKPEDVATGVIGDWQCYFSGFQKGDRVTIIKEPQ